MNVGIVARRIGLVSALMTASACLVSAPALWAQAPGADLTVVPPVPATLNRMRASQHATHHARAGCPYHS